MGTVQGFTLARSLQLQNEQIISGLVGLDGRLLLERRDGGTVDAGMVKGEKGDDAVRPFPSYSSGTDLRYIRLAVLDGIHASQGAAVQLIISGLGGFGTARRGTVLVHAAQRGVGGINLTAWSWGLDATAAGAITLYTRKMGDFLYEIWALIGSYSPSVTATILSTFGATVYLDSQTTVAPSLLVAGTITRSDSPAATTSLAGISELATSAETQAGTDAVRSVTPAGLASVVGVGLGYRFVERVIFTSSGSFTKASYPGCRAVRVLVVGGGGAGAGSAAPGSGSVHTSGGGGGGGGYSEKFILASALATSETVTIGVGGVGPTGGTGGGNGGKSSFGTAVVATGGTGGDTGPSSGLAISPMGGDGGIGTAGDILISGTGGGSGGGHATLGVGGTGGGTLLGGGTRGMYTGANAGNLHGLPGTNFGGGGGGAMSNQSGPASKGGNGAPGVVIVEVYR